jgi:hypothetical protein
MAWSLASALTSAKAAAAGAAKATHAAATAIAPELTASAAAAASAAHGAAAAAAARTVSYASGVVGAELATARDHLVREAEGIKAQVASTARLYTGDEPLSPALLALLSQGGFEAARGAPGKWLKAGAVLIDVGINSVDDAAAPRG